MKSSHVSAHAVWNSDLGKLVLTDATVFHAQLRKMGFGDGEALVVRVERQEDAYTYGALKHYWGHLVTPVSEFTGYTKHEVHWMLKMLFMPDGKTSITELNREELRAYTESVEQHMREELPEAFDASLQISAA